MQGVGGVGMVIHVCVHVVVDPARQPIRLGGRDGCDGIDATEGALLVKIRKAP